MILDKKEDVIMPAPIYGTIPVNNGHKMVNGCCVSEDVPDNIFEIHAAKWLKREESIASSYARWHQNERVYGMLTEKHLEGEVS